VPGTELGSPFEVAVYCEWSENDKLLYVMQGSCEKSKVVQYAADDLHGRLGSLAMGMGSGFYVYRKWSGEASQDPRRI
jgi:6-phosphogluconolactonase (cycloisomerase 2 family)